IADAASHEAGHAFGLRHQGKYVQSGNFFAFVQEYAPGNGQRAPLMGAPYTGTRTTWTYGTSSAFVSAPYPFTGVIPLMQDDMAEIARSENGFGYRQDDHADSPAFATVLTLAPRTPLDITLGRQSVSGSGIIERTTDVDQFTFTTTGGTATLA